ncbi:hypothetical protein ACOMHN_004689 [Nucella lapillus]
MLTTQEAVSFLQDEWGVERVQERFQDVSQRKGLLGEIIRQIHAKVTFQSVTLLDDPLADRKLPDAITIKEECMAGVCYNINVFVWGLLQAVGFTARLCRGEVLYPNDHVLVLVHDLEKEGDLHLVECGCTMPTFEAISLDFSEESPVFVQSFLEYKYMRHEGKIMRMHGDGDTMKHNDPPVPGVDFIVGKWRKFYSFVPVPVSQVSDLKEDFDKVFTLPHVAPFHHILIAVAFRNQRAVMIVNKRLTVEKENGEMETTVLDGDEAIVHSYRRYFPCLKEDAVRRALYHWHNATPSDGNQDFFGD